MPKTKTASGAKKRFKLTGAGKLLRRHATKRASAPGNLPNKSSKRRRSFRKAYEVGRTDAKSVRKLLGRG